mgnify:CR=1 FL=1
MAKNRTYQPLKSTTKLQLSIFATLAGRLPPAALENPIIANAVAMKAYHSAAMWDEFQGMVGKIYRAIVDSYGLVGQDEALVRVLVGEAYNRVRSYFGYGRTKPASQLDRQRVAEETANALVYTVLKARNKRPEDATDSNPNVTWGEIIADILSAFGLPTNVPAIPVTGGGGGA